jgi:serine/threonine-protein kinase HipA
MVSFYKTVVINFLLKNGDAHLKNFGLLFRDDFSKITLSPSYDIVSTVVYIFKDKPALNMFGKKVWHGKKELIEFGVKNCLLTKKEAIKYYNECFEAKEQIKLDIKDYISKNPGFRKIGNRMIDILELDDTKTIKEIDSELIRAWSEN